MYLILCQSYLNHSLRFVGEKKRLKKKSHIKSQSQYFGKKSQLDYFPKSFSPTHRANMHPNAVYCQLFSAGCPALPHVPLAIHSKCMVTGERRISSCMTEGVM